MNRPVICRKCCVGIAKIFTGIVFSEIFSIWREYENNFIFNFLFREEMEKFFYLFSYLERKQG